ncbi:MAG: nucleotidyltransferase family protein [Actinomycetota bacterium]
MGKIAAIVLAAGEASRYGAPKQRVLLPLELERLSHAPVDEIVIVAGAYELELPRGRASLDIPIRVVRCPEWKLGPGASLRCGLRAVADDVESAVVVLADGPNLDAAAIERVLSAWHPEGGIVAASYREERGHPLVLGRPAWRDIPDEGLRDRFVRLVPCDDLRAPGDIDTPKDLDAL